MQLRHMPLAQHAGQVDAQQASKQASKQVKLGPFCGGGWAGMKHMEPKWHAVTVALAAGLPAPGHGMARFTSLAGAVDVDCDQCAAQLAQSPRSLKTRVFVEAQRWIKIHRSVATEP